MYYLCPKCKRSSKWNSKTARLEELKLQEIAPEQAVIQKECTECRIERLGDAVGTMEEPKLLF